jgi:hypothetical protein
MSVSRWHDWFFILLRRTRSVCACWSNLAAFLLAIQFCSSALSIPPPTERQLSLHDSTLVPSHRSTPRIEADEIVEPQRVVPHLSSPLGFLDSLLDFFECHHGFQ